MKTGRAARIAGFAALASLACLHVPPCAAQPAVLALIVDDMGNARSAGERAARLPGVLTCAILPHTPYAAELARACGAEGKDVFVHLPMQPDDATARPGPGALLVGQSRRELRASIRDSLRSVEGASGVNSHMGSLFTRHIGYMDWLMSELSEFGGLVFVDSATTPHSVALRIAESYGLPAGRRDVFLDTDPAPEAVRRRWEDLLELAQSRGAAIGIGHPWESTLSLLESEMAGLEARGIMLVRVPELVGAYQAREVESWPRPSSPLQTVSKR